ncbi:rod shape-determining protein [Streptomyces boninensis]|uniref:rod shape-determining protein n=1 Tax=Streptomyces boninensis TaxID=2039455 RepID=UPI003B210E56
MTKQQSYRGRDLGIDLGTANTLVYAQGKGVVLNEPSVAAVSSAGEVLVVGAEAKKTIGRTPSGIVAVRPLRDGVIADFEIAERMLRHFIKKVSGSRLFRRGPRVVICIPSGITGVERRAVIEAADRAGAQQVHLIEEPLAAAIGAGLPVAEPTGCMVVDVGGGTTEVAVISLGGIVSSRSVRVAGDAMDTAISTYVHKEMGLALGERSAEELKMSIGSASPGVLSPAGLGALIDQMGKDPELRAAAAGDPEETAGLRAPDKCVVRGRELATGLPRTLELSEEQIRHALAEPVEAIISAVRDTLDDCPPELAGDIVDRGMVLTGGGALLRGLDQRLRQELGIPVTVADDPLNCVVQGTGQCVEDFERLKSVMDTGTSRRLVLAG